MADRWNLEGVEYTNCNCDYGCPCQFNAPTTHGFCEAISACRIDKGRFNDVVLDGLNTAMILHWPGEIAAGNGKQQLIIDERADAAQRDALRKIMHGEATTPGATHFYVFNSTMSEVLETLYAPVELEIDLEGRRAKVNVPGLLESVGAPIINPHSGGEHRAEIRLPDGFEYRRALMGSGTSKATAGIGLELKDSYGQFNALNMNQDGVIG